MRHDVDWVQRTHDALEHLHENIAQPIIFRGNVTPYIPYGALIYDGYIE